MARRWKPPKQPKTDDSEQRSSWSSMFSDLEKQKFLEAIQHEMQSRRILAQLFDGYLDGLMPDGTAIKCGFYNLAVKCAAAPISAYPVLVHEHFERVLPAVQERSAPPPTFEALAPRLVAHLYTDELLRASKAKPIQRPLAPGLWAVLTVDFGNALASLAPEAVAHLGVSHDELMRIGIENVCKHRCDRDPMPLPAGQQGFGLSSNEPTAASQVLHLGTHLGRHYPAGALVSLPTRNMLVCYPLQADQGRATLNAIRGFVQVADAIYSEAKKRNHKPFCQSYYWWRDGALSPFSASMGPAGVVIAPSEEFISLVLANP